MASRRRESRVERKPVAAFSAGFSLALKEGGTLVKNCRSRGTSREGSRFFRRLGRVTSSSDPRDHCLRSLACLRTRSASRTDVRDLSMWSGSRGEFEEIEEWWIQSGEEGEWNSWMEIEKEDLKIRSFPNYYSNFLSPLPTLENNVIILISRLFEMEISCEF